MRSSRVAKRYARALLEVAERGNEEKWGAELEKLAKTIESPELHSILTSPQLSYENRQKAMAKIAERLELSYPLRAFAVVVARHGRIEDVPAISDSYQQQLDERLARARATITFASEPGDDAIGRVVSGLERIAGKKIIPTVKVDRALLGGVVAELGGRIYDGSLATRLSEAQRRLAG